MRLGTVVLALALALSSQHVCAKRLGGGGSMGKQSSNVTQRSTAPAAPAAPTTQGATAAKAAPATAAAPPAKRPWGAMLGGLAAGLGLAWLASSLGLGAGFANFLLILLLAGLGFAAFAWLRRSRAPAAVGRSPLAYASATQADGGLPRSYSPQNVGNDASARPWERGNSTFGETEAAAQGSLIGAALSGSQGWGVPADFDTDGFLRASRDNFVRLQDAWDRGDVPTLRAMMTDDMLEQIQAQLSAREAQGPQGSHKTEVEMLEAKLLGIEEFSQEYMASVEFSGVIREEAAAGPNPFREVWNITRPKSGPGGWLVAGVQALQ